NILIKDDWSACLADFGLSIFSDATSTMSTNRGGSTYWMAPELLAPERFGLKFARTPSTDVYAFGCVCLELYTGRPPFSTLPEPAALLKVLDGERPERPSGPPVMTDILWQRITEFWAESTTRPSTQFVVQTMTWPIPVPPSPSPPPPNSSVTTNDVNHQPHRSVGSECRPCFRDISNLVQRPPNPPSAEIKRKTATHQQIMLNQYLHRRMRQLEKT
ncbi:kinase-like domain-containing protein, partial [Mycena galopus ATCC 62051]